MATQLAVDPVPERCVIVVDEALPAGLAANAAAVLALTLGARIPQLVGADFADADHRPHPGLIPMGLPVLKAPRPDLGIIAEKARAAGLDVIGFPAAGQTTNDYEDFRATVARTPSRELEYLGLTVAGPKRAVGRLTGSLALLR